MNLNNIPKKITTYLKEVRLETKNINWSTREETIKYTFIVVGFIIIIAILLGGFDFVFVNLLEYLINFFR